jgi:hypothetical protein
MLSLQINLILATMWDSVEVLLNNIAVSTHKANYPYKTYVPVLVNYSNLTKMAELQGAGWSGDIEGQFEVYNATNSGFWGRTKRFVEKTETFTPTGGQATLVPIYRTDATAFCGRLWTELSGFSGGVISGVKLNVNLVHAKDSFRLLTDETEKYKLVVSEAKLHVPVGVIHPLEWLVG